MTGDRQRTGRTGESIARAHLRRAGYVILETNYRNRLGEIDIIAKDGDSLVFVEVRTRRSRRFGSAKASITPEKRKRLARLAMLFMKETGQSRARARFDVVAVTRGIEGAEVEIVRNAFDTTGID